MDRIINKIKEVKDRSAEKLRRRGTEDIILPDAPESAAPYVIATDTSGNLPLELVKKHDIEVIPFVYSSNGEDFTCEDVMSFDGEGYYGRIKQGQTVTTSQITPQAYIDFFTPFLESGRDVIYVSMSSGISGSCDSARLAAKMLSESFPERRTAVIDTRGAALGEGLLAVKAAEFRDSGLGFSDCVKHIKDCAERMANIFTVDDLMYLRRGGRLSNFVAVVGTMLNIKPLLKGDRDGKIVAFSKLRGRKAAISALAKRYGELVREPEKQTVGIVHAACADDANMLARMIRAFKVPKELLVVPYEPVTGSYVGPGALALFFMGEKGIREAK